MGNIIEFHGIYVFMDVAIHILWKLCFILVVVVVVGATLCKICF